MNSMALKKGSIKYGKKNIEFLIIPSLRKTLEISVYPDKSVVVKPPVKTNYKAICEKVKKRAGWITKQRSYFEKFQPKTPARQYIGGETHLYLGRAYRLKIVMGKKNSISLSRGYFEVEVLDKPNSQTIGNLFEKWYKEKAEQHYMEIFENLKQKFKIKKDEVKKIQIKKMKTRWGSLSRSATLTLNSKLIQAPKECIEYVVAHELCHLSHENHGKGFYRLLKIRVPDWEKRKEKLETMLK